MEKLNKTTCTKVKKIVSKAKKNNLIVSHVKAFETNPVSKEYHKGKMITSKK